MMSLTEGFPSSSYSLCFSREMYNLLSKASWCWRCWMLTMVNIAQGAWYSSYQLSLAQSWRFLGESLTRCLRHYSETPYPLQRLTQKPIAWTLCNFQLQEAARQQIEPIPKYQLTRPYAYLHSTLPLYTQISRLQEFWCSMHNNFAMIVMKLGIFYSIQSTFLLCRPNSLSFQLQKT